MTITTYITAGIGGVALLALGSLLILPRHVHVERQAQLKGASAAQLLTLAASNAGYQRFNPYLSTDPALKITHFGPDSGVGSGFHFDGKEGKGSQTVAEVTENSVRYDIDLGSMGQPKQMIEIVPIGEHLKVTWSMDADLGMNPVARVFGLFMDRMVGKNLEQGLRNLATAL